MEIYGVAQVAGNFNATLTMTDATGLASSVTFPFHVAVLDLNSIANTASMASGTLGTAYSFTFRVLGGTAALTSCLSP